MAPTNEYPQQPKKETEIHSIRVVLTDAQTSLLADLCNSTSIITEQIKTLSDRIDRLYSHLGLR